MSGGDDSRSRDDAVRWFTLVGIGIVVLFFALTGWDLVRDNGVDGATVDDLGPGAVSSAMMIAVIGIGAWAVVLVSIGAWAKGTIVGLVTVLVVVFSAAESFAAAEADHCECVVSDRHGMAEAVWLAFDTVPILKVNETLGWSEPQPLSAVTSSPDDLETPVRRWFPALLVRFAVGFILLALLKGLFDLARKPSGDSPPAEG
ncbi:MAG: hypothetical protein QNM02_05655 [Acidimicrobiia bacterium]|nr:hypothetical protein [Acidimicrobiia bacterium]